MLDNDPGGQGQVTTGMNCELKDNVWQVGRQRCCAGDCATKPQRIFGITLGTVAANDCCLLYTSPSPRD